MKLSDNEKMIRKKIEEALKSTNETLTQDEIRDFAFHMTDWIDDLNDLVRFYSSPDSISVDEVNEILMRFSIHVPPHVMEAAEILLGEKVENIFRQ